MKPFIFCALAVAFGLLTLQSVKSHHADPQEHCHQAISYPGP